MNNENVRQEVYGQSEIDEMESLRKIAFSRLRDCKTKLPTSMSIDNDHIANQFRAELELRLLETLCPAAGSRPGRKKFSFELPPHLLSIIAAHVIQEAANEPYGLKGNLKLL